MNTLLEKCGFEAEAAFAASGNDPYAFTKVSSDLLDQWDLAPQISVDALFEAALQADAAGKDGSQKPGLIELFHGDHVRMVAHLWSDAADRLHQHDWTGAFQVIDGQSFNSTFEYVEGQQIDEFGIGALARAEFKVFEAGAIQPVAEGDRLIHSVVYPGKPGLAISLRVSGEWPKGAFEYLRPGLKCPSHRRRGASAAQLDLLGQAFQVDEALYVARFTAFAELLAPASLLRLLDAVAFDSLPMPNSVIDLAKSRLPQAEIVLASLNDIERSDKTRELLGDAPHPKLRQFICALFHSESRSELAEAMRVSGFDDPVLDAGRGLAVLIVDDEDGALPPEHVASALGDAAMTGDVRAAIESMRVRAEGADHLDQHCEFIAAAYTAMEEAPIFRCLFTP